MVNPEARQKKVAYDSLGIVKCNVHMHKALTHELTRVQDNTLSKLTMLSIAIIQLALYEDELFIIIGLEIHLNELKLPP